MAMQRALIAGMVAINLCGTARAAPTTIELARNGGWVVNYAEDKCHLIGEFGATEDKITAVFMQSGLGDTFDLRLVGSPLWSKGKDYTSRVSFGPEGTEAAIPIASAEIAGLPAMLFSNLRFDPSQGGGAGGPSQATPSQPDARLRDLSFTTYNRKAYRLKLGSMKTAMQAMRTCLQDLMQKTGYDPALATSLKSLPEPIGNPGAWVTSLDIPASRMKPGTSGLLRFKLGVDETGRVTGCEVIEETKGYNFASLACALLLKRARFHPAIALTGQPAKGQYINTLRWMAGPF